MALPIKIHFTMKNLWVILSCFHLSL